MSIKYREYQDARNEGIQFALKIAKERGIEALEEEAEFRKTTGIPLKVDREQYKEALTEMYNKIVDTIMTVTLAALNREYDMGSKRLNRFLTRFDFIFECLEDPDNVTLKEIAENLEDEAKLKGVAALRRVIENEKLR